MTKKILFTLVTVVFLGGTMWAAVEPGLELDRHNVVWTTPSQNSHGAMPLGNGDVGISAWVEPGGDLIAYVSKTDAWDENGRLCKIGRVRVKFEPPLDLTHGFRQELKLRDGSIEIQTGQGNLRSTIQLWVDANQPIVRMDASFGQLVDCQAEVELWRQQARPFGKEDDSHSGSGLSEHEAQAQVLPDVVLAEVSPRVVWYHRNTRSIYPLTLQTQHLGVLQDWFPDPLLNHTFGASLSGPGLVRAGQRFLRSTRPSARQQLAIAILAQRAPTLEPWMADLQRLELTAAQTGFTKSQRSTQAWWREFWQRSWVILDGEGQGGQPPVDLERGYLLQRFMNACSGRGGAPIKFNGSMFTVEKTPGASPETFQGDPDWRQWGSSYWFQNTRLAYWPMLASGDFELMQPWFRMYLNALPLSEARARKYYDFADAAAFPETMYFWGLPNNNDYGWKNVAPEPANPYIKRYWSGGLELIAAMLDCYDFTQDRRFARLELIPLADPILGFFDQYWKRDAQGKIRFEPAQSLETWHVAVNPMPEIAGLRYVLPRLLALPPHLTTETQRARWNRLSHELPPIPVASVHGQKLLRPAEEFASQSNSENPELYAVFPFRLFGVGRPDLDLAVATFEARAFRHNRGWCQDSIQAACLGLAEEAGRLVTARAAQTNATYRFPAMWGPNFDWIPDQDHGNNLLTTLQFMLLQSEGDRIYLCPAWPPGWNVSFKLHAPKNTVVEGIVRQGKLISLQVTPRSRAANVVNLLAR